MSRLTTPDRYTVKATMESAILASRFEAMARLWMAALLVFVITAVASIAMERYDPTAGSAVFSLVSWTAHLFAREKASSLGRERRFDAANRLPSDDPVVSRSIRRD